MTTCMDVCYVELGYLPLRSIILSKQKVFPAVVGGRHNMLNMLTWLHAVRLTMAHITPTKAHINSFINNVVDDVAIGIQPLKLSIVNSTSSRRQSYLFNEPFLNSSFLV